MNGIICIDKPQDFTSFDAVAKLRGILKMKRIGHGGTLDPMATGVLPIFLGTATKACDMIDDDLKAYEAEFELGIVTDTLDITGNILKRTEAMALKYQIENALAKFRGEIEQIPPMYSAVSVNGQKLYKLARKGITVERKPRRITVFSLELNSFDTNTQTGSLSVTCSKGTYIRTLIDDIGSELGCGAVMTSLRRTRSLGFTLDDCLTFEEVKALADANELEKRLLAPQKLFEGCPEIMLDKSDTQRYKNGVKLPLDRVLRKCDVNRRYAVFGFDGEFLGTARADTDCNLLIIEKNFYTR